MRTMQAADGPALELSDIMHTMSPSPVPQLSLPLESAPLPSTHIAETDIIFPVGHNALTTAHLQGTRISSPSPEPLDHSELEAMRFRIHQLGFAGPHSPNPTATLAERELAWMALRLISHPILHPSPSQLASQAETIAELTLQRNILLREREDEHARWEVEREGWDRSAEALIGKRRAATATADKDYDSERLLARLRDDNWALRHKLSDTHSRMSALESELERLRPLLLMQPAILRDPSLLQHPAFLQLGLPEEKVDMKKKRKARRDKERVKKEKERSLPAVMTSQVHADVEGDTDPEGDVVMDVDSQTLMAGEPMQHEQSNTQASDMTMEIDASQASVMESTLLSGNLEADPYSTPPQSAPQRTTKIRHSKPDEKPEKRFKDKKARNKPPDDRTPLLSDARAECLLVAARKMGRVRAGFVANLAKEREEHERAREQEEKLAAQAAKKAGAQQKHGRTPNGEHMVAGQWQYVWEGQAGPSNYAAYPPMTLPVVSPVPVPAARVGSQPGSATAPFPRQPHFPPSMQGSPRQLPVPPVHSRLAQSLITAHPPYSMPHPGIVYMQSVPSPPGAPGQVTPGGPMMVPIAAATWPMPSTPTGKHRQNAVQGQTPVRNGRDAQSTPTTPMDSLLSAARTLMIDEDYDGDEDSATAGAANSRGAKARTASAAALESPVPKKRKVGRASTLSSITTSPTRGTRTRRQTKAAAQEQQQEKKSKGKQREVPQDVKGKSKDLAPAPVGLTRAHSGLDVLAQAADEQDRQPPSGPGSRRESTEPEKRQTVPTSRSGEGRANNHSVDATMASSIRTPSSIPVDFIPEQSASPYASSAMTDTNDSTVLTEAAGLTNGIRQQRRRPPSAPPAPMATMAHIGTLPLSMNVKHHDPLVVPPEGKDTTSIRHDATRLAQEEHEHMNTHTISAAGSQSSHSLQLLPLPMTPPRPRASRAATEEPSPREWTWKHTDSDVTASIPPHHISSDQGVATNSVVRPLWLGRTREIEVIPVGRSVESTPMEVEPPTPPQSNSNTVQEGTVTDIAPQAVQNSHQSAETAPTPDENLKT